MPALVGGGVITNPFSPGYKKPPSQKPPSQMSQYKPPAQPPPPPPPQPMQQQMQMPQAQQYQAYRPQQINYQQPGAGQLGESLGQMGGFASGMLDPESDYYKRLVAGMEEQIGKQSAARQRSAALRGAYGGLGGGRGGEVMQTQADIGQAGLEAMGGAAANLRLQAPQMGMQALQSTFGPQLGMQQMQEQGRQFGMGLSAQERARAEQSRQFGAGMGEQARQFGVGAGLQSQQMAQQAAMQQWQMQQQQWQAEQQRQQQIMQMMAGMFG